LTAEFLRNSSRILIRILVGNNNGKYINEVIILIRILVGNATNPADDCGIPLEFWLECGKCIRWLYNSSRIRIRILVGNAANPSDYFGNPLEFSFEFQLNLNSAKSADYV
jgi:hypothetical protein